MRIIAATRVRADNNGDALACIKIALRECGRRQSERGERSKKKSFFHEE
jgi:hypothetical protein